MFKSNAISDNEQFLLNEYFTILKSTLSQVYLCVILILCSGLSTMIKTYSKKMFDIHFACEAECLKNVCETYETALHCANNILPPSFTNLVRA